MHCYTTYPMASDRKCIAQSTPHLEQQLLLKGAQVIHKGIPLSHCSATSEVLWESVAVYCITLYVTLNIRNNY